MPNFQNNIQRDSNGNIGINRPGATVEQQLHIDGVLHIGQDFAGGNAVKIRYDSGTGKLQKDEGSGWIELGSGAGLPDPLPMVANATQDYILSPTPKTLSASGPINPIGSPAVQGSPLLYSPTPETIQSAPLSGLIAEV